MVAITATSYATPSAQAWQSRAKLEQARREADQAESEAKQLRTQADQAENEAQKGQAKVSTLASQVAQVDSTYSSQVRKKAAVAENKKVQEFLAPVVAAADNNFSFPSNPLVANDKLWSSLTQKPTSGRIINQTA
jgi:septal ring factor EnvC (AmiA/AmiB activator)